MTELPPDSDLPLVPPNGWQLDDFPRMTVAPIAYVTNPALRADPAIQLSPEGWLYMDLGGTRVAVPNRDEWDKLVSMVERMWNSSEVARQQADLKKLDEYEGT